MGHPPLAANYADVQNVIVMPLASPDAQSWAPPHLGLQCAHELCYISWAWLLLDWGEKGRYLPNITCLWHQNETSLMGNYASPSFFAHAE